MPITLSSDMTMSAMATVRTAFQIVSDSCTEASSASSVSSFTAIQNSSAPPTSLR